MLILSFHPEEFWIYVFYCEFVCLVLAFYSLTSVSLKACEKTVPNSMEHSRYHHMRELLNIGRGRSGPIPGRYASADPP